MCIPEFAAAAAAWICDVPDCCTIVAQSISAVPVVRNIINLAS